MTHNYRCDELQQDQNDLRHTQVVAQEDTCLVLPKKGEFKVWNFDTMSQTPLNDPQNKRTPILNYLVDYKDKNKKLKLAICITIYNEGRALFKRTLDSIKRNIDEFKRKNLLEPEEIAVFLLCDGFEKVNEEVLEELKEIFQSELNPYVRKAKISKTIKDAAKHNAELVKKGQEPPLFPDLASYVLYHKYKHDTDETAFTNLVVCIKAQNGGKLSSHLWFFLGFCEYFVPDYVALVDAGTVLDKNAFVEFYIELAANKHVGGVAGFMSSLDDEKDEPSKWYTSLAKAPGISLISAQLYEYTYGHVLDKGFESLTGFIHVLPGAFSGYRYEAMRNIDLFSEYFNSIVSQKTDFSCPQGNRMLAEDRIMCLWIYCSKGKSYSLKYVPTAWAWTDLPNTVPALIGQRRRWLNGTMFALLDTLRNYPLVYKSGHKLGVISFAFNLIYSAISLAASYLGLGLFYASCWLMFSSLTNETDENTTFTAGGALANTFLLSVVGTVYMSLLFKINEEPLRIFLKMMVPLMGVYYLLLWGVVIYFAVSNLKWMAENRETGLILDDSIWLAAFIIVVIASHGVPLLFYPRRTVDVIRGLVSYLFYTPLYVTIMPIYAFCQLDDLSWGTKGAGDHILKGNEKEKKLYQFKDFKIQNVIIWIALNIFVGFGVIRLNELPSTRNQFLLWYGGLFAAIIGIKAIGGTIYIILFRLRRLCCQSRRIRRIQERERSRRARGAGPVQTEVEVPLSNNTGRA